MIFRIKDQKNAANLKESIKQCSNIMTSRFYDGVKYAGGRISYLGDYAKKIPDLGFVKQRIQKHPGGIALTVAGIGLAIYGLINLMKK